MTTGGISSESTHAINKTKALCSCSSRSGLNESPISECCASQCMNCCGSLPSRSDTLRLTGD
eukprot:scaffold13449_cov30-Prasinocladus_malaysianus.AAC.1